MNAGVMNAGDTECAPTMVATMCCGRDACSILLTHITIPKTLDQAAAHCFGAPCLCFLICYPFLCVHCVVHCGLDVTLHSGVTIDLHKKLDSSARPGM